MDEEAITQFLCTSYDDVQVTSVDETSFFFYGSGRKYPFATLSTKDDDSDRSSNLNRPSVYRLNIGVSKETYRSKFGPEPAQPYPAAACAVETGHDFSGLDQLMPHPIYAGLAWLCVLNPGQVTFQQQVRPLLDEAYKMAVRRETRKATDESAATSG
jgi:hypothetical protein